MSPPKPDKLLIICLGSSVYKHSVMVLMVDIVAIVTDFGGQSSPWGMELELEPISSNVQGPWGVVCTDDEQLLREAGGGGARGQLSIAAKGDLRLMYMIIIKTIK